MIKTVIKIITVKIIAMILMYLWLVVIMLDINYLSNKILSKQSWKACTKQLRAQCGSITLSNSSRQYLVRLWTGLEGTGYIYMHKACGTLWSALRSKRDCAEDPVSSLYTFQGKVITSVSYSHFPLTGCSLVVDVHWLCTEGASSCSVSSERDPLWLLSGSSTVRTSVLWVRTMRRLCHKHWVHAPDSNWHMNVGAALHVKC